MSRDRGRWLWDGCQGHRAGSAGGAAGATAEARAAVSLPVGVAARRAARGRSHARGGKVPEDGTRAKTSRECNRRKRGADNIYMQRSSSARVAKRTAPCAWPPLVHPLSLSLSFSLSLCPGQATLGALRGGWAFRAALGQAEGGAPNRTPGPPPPPHLRTSLFVHALLLSFFRAGWLLACSLGEREGGRQDPKRDRSASGPPPVTTTNTGHHTRIPNHQPAGVYQGPGPCTDVLPDPIERRPAPRCSAPGLTSGPAGAEKQRQRQPGARGPATWPPPGKPCYRDR
eukprot:scaffold4990_cov387-Prasinococcus_capsulatus_cf.AAC.24